jgi:hypothetical protein
MNKKITLSSGVYNMQAEAYPWLGYKLIRSTANCQVEGSRLGHNLIVEKDS